MNLPPDHTERGPLRKVWAEFNKLRAYVQSIAPVAGTNVTIDRTTRGSIIRARPGGDTSPSGTATNIGVFRVTAVGSSTLTCTYSGGDPNSFPDGSISVAKPFGLATRDWSGGSYRSVSGTTFNDRKIYWTTGTPQREFSWDEWIWPPYKTLGAADGWPSTWGYIIAGALPLNSLEGYTQAGDDGNDWIDLNADGRSWHVKPRMFAVCVDGAAKQVAIAGGEPAS